MTTAFLMAMAVAVLAALTYWERFAALPEGDSPWLGSVVKTLGVAALAVAAALGGAPTLIVAGLALGALGDLALSRPGQPAFLAGMAAFALGHLAYALAFWGWGGAGIGFGQLLTLGLLASLLQSTEIWLAPRTADLRLPVRAYVVIIGMMAALAVLLAARPGTAFVQAGVGLFVTSDLLLALRLFVVAGARGKRIMGYAVWPAYWLGQALILWGALQMTQGIRAAPFSWGALLIR